MRVCAVYHRNDGFSFIEYNLRNNEILQIDEKKVLDSDFDHYILSGFYSSCIVREITVPRQVKRRDIPDAVLNEFFSKLPTTSVFWQYQIISSATKTEDYVIRCCAINKDTFSPILKKLTESNIKLDSVIFSPLMLSDAVFPEISNYGSPTLKNFKNYTKKYLNDEFDTFCSKHPLTNSDEDMQLSLFATIRYLAHSKEWSQVHNPPDLLPETVKPTRFQKLHKLNVLLITATIFFISSIAYKQYQYSNNEYKHIKQQNSQLKNELKELRLKLGQVNNKVALLESYDELNAGNALFALSFCELTEKIPPHMWAKSFRMVNNSINLTLESSKDDVNFYNVLKGGKHYNLVNLRKSRAEKNKFNYTVTVEAKPQ